MRIIKFSNEIWLNQAKTHFNKTRTAIINSLKNNDVEISIYMIQTIKDLNYKQIKILDKWVKFKNIWIEDAIKEFGYSKSYYSKLLKDNNTIFVVWLANWYYENLKGKYLLK